MRGCSEAFRTGTVPGNNALSVNLRRLPSEISDSLPPARSRENQDNYSFNPRDSLPFSQTPVAPVLPQHRF